jgi:uncharacterized protein (DUF305 family)
LTGDHKGDKTMKLVRMLAMNSCLACLMAGAGCESDDATSASSIAACTDGGVRTLYDATPVQGLDAAGDARPTYGSPIPLTPGNDVAFIDFMIPELGRGVVMANQVIDRGMRPEVKNFATRVRQEEQGAMNQLMAARTALTGSAEAPTAPRDPRAEQVTMQLMTQSGTSLEDLYLRSILGHHGHGMEVILRALPNLENMQVRGLAGMMLETNADEIGEVQQLRHMH